jgi:hypothetical protein
MILVWAIGAGLLAGAGRAWIGRRKLISPDLRLLWLVPVAYLPQLVAFNWPTTNELLPENLAAVALVSSQILLLIFAWVNRKKPGFWALTLGLTLNLLVITLNGGLMPISPENVILLSPDAALGSWQVNHRLWGGKDIVLPVNDTRLWWLSDCFLLPAWMPFQVAFSVGDIFIALGAFLLLWVSGGVPQYNHR